MFLCIFIKYVTCLAARGRRCGSSQNYFNTIKFNNDQIAHQGDIVHFTIMNIYMQKQYIILLNYQRKPIKIIKYYYLYKVIDIKIIDITLYKSLFFAF